ncbi:hypothetical protein [Paenibacillus sp. AR247]|uniref:hypothetical protein n=1 Tax=Paenibacillus sp. AR247 TaxID=1631599 RepID=UPI000CF8E834|nr:hypothetical protein [Paenibacillus sp. AR247]PQP89673.1 hypothetical protein CPT76_16895 [Paenibacillus sp. AR247]
MKNLREVAPAIVDNETGQGVPFAQYLEEQAGTGELFNSDIGMMLTSALSPRTDWEEVNDYLAPIVKGVLSEAVQMEDKRIYIVLVLAIKEAWQELCEHHEVEKTADREFQIDLDDPGCISKFEQLLKDLSYGRQVVKSHKVEAPGSYRLTVGYRSN